MVMQAAADFLVGGPNPGAANTTDQDSNRRPKILQLGALPFDRSWVCHKCASPLLGAFSAKTFDPPSKKCYLVLGVSGLRIKKSIGALSYWEKS